jgi:hypothetical protein
MSICRRTGLTRPECSCPDCLTEQIRRFRPALVEADPAGEIRTAQAAAPPKGQAPGQEPAQRRAA